MVSRIVGEQDLELSGLHSRKRGLHDTTRLSINGKVNTRCLSISAAGNVCLLQIGCGLSVMLTLCMLITETGVI